MIRASALTLQSRFAPGAGRIVDLIWPAKIGYAANAALGFPGAMTRLQGTPLNDANTSSQGLIGGGNAPVYRIPGGGRPFIEFSSAVAAVNNGVQQTIDNFVMLPNLNAAQSGNYGDAHDYTCYRSYGILYMSPQPSYASDCGIQWTADQNAGARSIKRTLCNGFGFTQTSDTDVSFIWASAGVLRNSVVVFSGNLSVWRMYEVRVLSAIGGREAQVKVFVDNALALTVPWIDGGGANFFPPPMARQVGNVPVGLGTVLVNTCGGSLLIGMQTRFMIAPTEDALL